MKNGDKKSVKPKPRGKTTGGRVKRNGAPSEAPALPNGIKTEITAILLLMLAVFVYVSIHKFAGLTDDNALIGFAGAKLVGLLNLLFGEASVMIPFFILAWAIHIGSLKEVWSSRMLGITLLALAFLLNISLYHIPGGLSPMEAGIKGIGGGYAGGALAYVLQKLVGNIGCVILMVLDLVIAAILIVNQPLAKIMKEIRNLAKKAGSMMESFIFEEDVAASAPPASAPPYIVEPEPEPRLIVHSVPELHDSIEPKGKKENEPVEKASTQTVKTSGGTENYCKPPLDLLSNMSNERTIDKKNIKESIGVLEDTFDSFGIKVKVNQVSCGPAVTRFELTPAPGVKVSKIISLTDDLQLNLAAPGIRIEAPIPGKSAIGIEVPNNKILSVGLRNLISSPAFSRLDSPLAFALGEDISGNTVVARLNDMPHLLIAGSTGSGKSVCLNCIIMSLLYNASPDELRLVFIDPKMVELTVYNGIPHLLTPVVTDSKKAAVVLRWMVNEMEKRYKLFSDRGVRDIHRYNQVAKENKLPFILIIIDELADLMMAAPVEVEDSVCRLAQMARAAGMHMIVATQRPSVDVVTGVIKANIPSRIAFAVSSQADSRTILDGSGAEKLLGKGDMLFMPVGAVKPFRIQGAYVSDQDIENTVAFIKEHSSADEEAEENPEIELSLAQAEMDEGDELFWDAVGLFVESGKASVSLLQRRLRIGYARAARLVDLMEDRGFVSQLDNNKKREVLLDQNQLEKIQARTI